MCGRCQGAPLCCICFSSTHLLWASSLGASGSPAPGPRLLSLSCSSVPSIFWDKDSPFTGPDKSAEKRQVGTLGAVLTHTTPLQRLGTTRTSTAGCPGTQPSPQHRYPSSGLTKTAIRMAPRLNCPSPEADLSMDFPHCPLQENSYTITSMCSARTDCWARSHETKGRSQPPAACTRFPPMGVSTFLHLPGALDHSSKSEPGPKAASEALKIRVWTLRLPFALTATSVQYSSHKVSLKNAVPRLCGGNWFETAPSPDSSTALM